MIATLALSLLLCAQRAPDDTTSAVGELRFHRVHLRNGNFLDGDLVRQTSSAVFLRVRFGEMSISRALIERVEYVKMRGVQDKAEEVAAPKPSVFAPAPAAVERRDPFTTPRGPSPRSTLPKAKGAAPAPFNPPAELKTKVDAVVAKLQRAKDDEVDGVLREMAVLGNETAPYLAALMEKMDPRTAELLGTVLTQQTNEAAVPYVLRLATHPEALLRAQAALALGSNGGVKYAAEIVTFGRDKESVVRIAAVTALASFDDEAVWEPVTGFALDKDREVRTRALGTLARLAVTVENLKDRLSVTLGDILDKASPEGRADVLGALGRTKDAATAPRIAPHLKDGNPAVRIAAAKALAELNNRDTADELVNSMAGEDNGDVREALADAAATFRAKEAVDTLISWLGDESDKVKKAAERALKEITRQDFGTDVEKWSAWWESNK